MQFEHIQQLIKDALPGSEVTISGDGSHFDIVVVSDLFEGKSMVQEQKMVYAALAEQITGGEMHAVTIKAYTPAEWQKARLLQVK